MGTTRTATNPPHRNMRYSVRHACFAVTTPYQIIGAIGIVLREKIEADLYLFGMFEGYAQVAKNIEKEQIFQQVYCVDPREFQFTKKAAAFKQILNYRKTVASFLPGDVAYEVYYTTSRAHVKTLMIHELRRRNPGMSYVIYEDGIGMYRPEKLAIVTTKRRELLEKLLGWNMFEPEKTTVLAYEPSLVEASPKISRKAVAQMPRIEWKSPDRNIINRIFSIHADEYIKERFIIFDNIRWGQAENDKRMDAAIRTVLSSLGRDDVICKPHPRSLSASDTGVKIYPHPGIPIEALYANMEDLSDRVLISCTSTAAMTPRLLFGCEPVIIDIHRLINEAPASENEVMLDKITSMYQNKAHVIRIRTESELAEAINRVK